MEIIIKGKGADPEKVLTLKLVKPDPKDGDSELFVEDKCFITLGLESITVDPDELRRASIALCPTVYNELTM